MILASLSFATGNFPGKQRCSPIVHSGAAYEDLKQLDAKLTKMTRIFTEVYPSLLRPDREMPARSLVPKLLSSSSA